ncbi:MAG TPA: hypothetical protein VI670_05255 [Thermoanaerobaculia bacterium]|jgi:hypothetical protein
MQNWTRSLSAICILHSAFVLVLLAACAPKPNTPQVSKEPVSVRGWVLDVEGSSSPIRTAETEAARKTHLFQSTYVEVVNAPYVSGGIAENGSFLLLDVPPGKVTIVFTAPGAPAAKLEIDNVPGNADIFLPALLLERNGVTLADPAAVKVRMAARIDTAKPNGQFVTIAGRRLPVIDTPIAQMADRHDYPIPPTTMVPIAKVK